MDYLGKRFPQQDARERPFYATNIKLPWWSRNPNSVSSAYNGQHRMMVSHLELSWLEPSR